MRCAVQACVLIVVVSFSNVADAGRLGEGPGASKYSPEEAGARYGQALGAGRLCRDFKVSPGAEELAATCPGKSDDRLGTVFVKTQRFYQAHNCLKNHKSQVYWS